MTYPRLQHSRLMQLGTLDASRCCNGRLLDGVQLLADAREGLTALTAALEGHAVEQAHAARVAALPATRLILLHGQIYALGPGVISGKSIYAPVGRALLRSASLECDFGAWDVEAKLACPRSKHTTYPSYFPQHTLVPTFPSPIPPSTTSCVQL